MNVTEAEAYCSEILQEKVMIMNKSLEKLNGTEEIYKHYLAIRTIKGKEIEVPLMGKLLKSDMQDEYEKRHLSYAIGKGITELPWLVIPTTRTTGAPPSFVDNKLKLLSYCVDFPRQIIDDGNTKTVYHCCANHTDGRITIIRYTLLKDRHANYEYYQDMPEEFPEWTNLIEDFDDTIKTPINEQYWDTVEGYKGYTNENPYKFAGEALVVCSNDNMFINPTGVKGLWIKISDKHIQHSLHMLREEIQNEYNMYNNL